MSILSENIDYSAIVGETYLVIVRVERQHGLNGFKKELVDYLRDVGGLTKRNDITDTLSSMLFNRLVEAPNAILDDIGLNALFEEYGDFSFIETTEEKHDYRTKEYGQRHFSSSQSVYITLTPRDHVSFARRS